MVGLGAQQPSNADTFETDGKILDEIKDHSEIMTNLEYLSDSIGPRLTGTENLDKASHWTAQKFDQYGLSAVHLEPWTIHHAWYRGSASARIVVDTFDKANKENLVEGAQVVAAWAWNTAALSEMMPRKPLSEEPRLPF
jgi:hypothetical protein